MSAVVTHHATSFSYLLMHQYICVSYVQPMWGLMTLGIVFRAIACFVLQWSERDKQVSFLLFIPNIEFLYSIVCLVGIKVKAPMSIVCWESCCTEASDYEIARNTNHQRQRHHRTATPSPASGLKNSKFDNLGTGDFDGTFV